MSTDSTDNAERVVEFGGRGVISASRTWQILYLGMRFPNKCGLRLNLRRMGGPPPRDYLAEARNGELV